MLWLVVEHCEKALERVENCDGHRITCYVIDLQLAISGAQMLRSSSDLIPLIAVTIKGKIKSSQAAVDLRSLTGLVRPLTENHWLRLATTFRNIE